MSPALFVSIVFVSRIFPVGVSSTSVLPPLVLATIRLPFGSSACATGASSGEPLYTSVAQVLDAYLHLNFLPPGSTTISFFSSRLLAFETATTVLSTPSTIYSVSLHLVPIFVALYWIPDGPRTFQPEPLLTPK